MLLFVAVNAAVGFAAWRVGNTLQAAPWTRGLVALLVFQLLAVGLALLTGALGLQPWVLAFGALAVAAASLALPRPPLPKSEHGWGEAVLFGTLGVWFARAGLLGTHLSYDDTTYHAAIPAAWLTEGGLHVVPYTYQAYYPLFAESLAFWFMLPTGNLTHAGLASMLQAFTFAAAGMAMAERLEWDRNLAALWLANLLIARRIYQLVYGVSANDLAVAALVLGAFVLCARSGSRRELVLAGLAAGAALATKVTALVLLAPLLAYGLYQNRRQFGWLALSLLVVGSPVYLHNLWLTGNPIFPAENLLFAGPMERTAQTATSLLPFLGEHLAEIVRNRLNWPHVLGGLALLGLMSALVLGVQRKQPERLLLACMAVLALLLWPTQPFSGSINRPGAELNLIARFILPSIAFGVLLLNGKKLPKQLAVGPTLLFPVVLGLSWELHRPWELSVGAGIGVVWLLLRGRLATYIPWLALVALAAIAVRTPQKRAKTRTDLVRSARSALPQAPVTRAIEKLPDGSVLTQIAEVPVSHDHSIRAYGTLLQHRYQPVDLDGSALRPLHERWRDEPASWFWRWNASYAPDFAQRLSETGVDYLVVTRCNDSNRWPKARAQLLENPGQRVFKSRCGEIWRID